MYHPKPQSHSRSSSKQPYPLNDEQSFDQSSTTKHPSLGYFQILSSILVTIAKGEHILQCIRQALTQDNTFTPLTLFKYISRNSHYFLCQNIMVFMDENNLINDEKQTEYYLKKVFNRYGVNHDNIQYTNFLNFVYPWNSGVLRDLAVNRVKNYQQLDKFQKNLRPSDSILTGFLSLLEQEIILQRKIEAQLCDPRFPNKQKLHKIIKSIKKASQKMCATIIQKSNSHISMLELRNFIKAFIEVPEHLFIYLGRRLAMNKSGMIPLQVLQAIFKKTNSKFTNSILAFENNKENENDQINFIHTNGNVLESDNSKKYEKQLMYREELYRQLAQTLKIKQQKIQQKERGRTPRSQKRNRSKTPRRNNDNINNNVAINPYNIDRKDLLDAYRTPINNIFHNQEEHEIPTIKQSLLMTNKTNHLQNMRNHKPSRRNKKQDLHQNNRQNRNQQQCQQKIGSLSQSFEQNKQQKHNVCNKNKPKNAIKQINTLFKQYTEIFLKGTKQINKCKNKNNVKVDYLALFKTIDHGKGTVNAQDIRNLYVRLSGIPIDYDFSLIVRRYAQPQEQFLSYSEFMEIFKTNNTPVQNHSQFTQAKNFSLKASIDLTPQNIRILAQILYLTLDLEHCENQIIKKIKPEDRQWLFDQISSQSESGAKNFINYQQLKKYMNQNLDLQISMTDLMSLLKRLDKSKNGVVVREQFLKF